LLKKHSCQKSAGGPARMFYNRVILFIMKDAMARSYFWTMLCLILHQIDAAYWREWEMF